MVILAYSFRLESADQFPDARTAAAHSLSTIAHIASHAEPTGKMAERVPTPPTKSSGEQQWPLLV